MSWTSSPRTRERHRGAARRRTDIRLELSRRAPSPAGGSTAGLTIHPLPVVSDMCRTTRPNARVSRTHNSLHRRRT
eukprot:6313584-Heterocapsa_arctica.AAC.1